MVRSLEYNQRETVFAMDDVALWRKHDRFNEGSEIPRCREGFGSLLQAARLGRCCIMKTVRHLL
jgi:hypothetical protein